MSQMLTQRRSVELNADGRLPSLLYDELDNLGEARVTTDNRGGV